MLQNIAITLLSVSAVLLFIQTQSYMLSTDDGFVGNLFQSGAPGADTSSQPAAAALSAPVRAAVSGTYGRYGDISLSNGFSLRALPVQCILRLFAAAAAFCTVHAGGAGGEHCRR